MVDSRGAMQVCALLIRGGPACRRKGLVEEEEEEEEEEKESREEDKVRRGAYLHNGQCVEWCLDADGEMQALPYPSKVLYDVKKRYSNTCYAYCCIIIIISVTSMTRGNPEQTLSRSRR